MSDMGPQDIEVLVDEVLALRAENQRLCREPTSDADTLPGT